MKWWQIKKRDADLERELQSDLELEEEEQREGGISAEEARYAALRAFGNPTLIREHTRAVWSWNRLENLLRDLRISVRTLLRSPGFSMIAVLVMALCIGAATSLFTVVRSVLLRPLPFRDPERLVMIYEHFRDPSMNAQEFNYNPVAPADYYDWRAQTHGFEDMAAWRWWQFNLTGEHGELPELVNARAAGAGTCFRCWGCTRPSDARLPRAKIVRTEPPSCLRGISSSGGSAAIHRLSAGKSISTESHIRWWACFPSGSPIPMRRCRSGSHMRRGCRRRSCKHHDFHFSRVVARLRPDVSLASALSQVEAVQYQLHLQNLNAPVAEDVASKTLIQDLARDVKKPLIILLCAVACMLLIGCLNVANLMVARSAARQKEIAIRSALGARRMTLIREQLVESLLVSIAGGATGVLLSMAATKWLVSTWRDLPSAQSIHADGVVLAFACALVFATALLAGLLPAISSTAQGSDRGAAGFVAERDGQPIAHRVAQDAAYGGDCDDGGPVNRRRPSAQELLASADDRCGLRNRQRAHDGLQPSRKKIRQSREGERIQRNAAGARARYAGCTRRSAGVDRAWSGILGSDDDFTIPEHPPIAPGALLPDALYRTADPGYFSALQIPLLSGRFFTSEDRAGHPKTVIISRQLAQQYFPGENPLGKHLHVVRR